MITYSNFWPGFDGRNSLLEHLINSTIPKSLHVNVNSAFVFPTLGRQFKERLKAQLGITSFENYRELALYRHPPINPKADINIWYTAENLRPPSHGYDLAFSFDKTDLNLKVPNIHLPYWMYNLNWGINEREETREYFPSPSELFLPKLRVEKRSRYCCTFMNNSEPTRLSLLNTLELIAPVDKYGTLFKRPVPRKEDVALDYTFMFTPENSYYPGYITEKVFEARNVGCIPIWWGCNETKTLNPRALLDITFLNSTEIVERIELIRESEQLQQEMLAEPILLDQPQIEPVIQSMRNVFKQFN